MLFKDHYMITLLQWNIALWLMIILYYFIFRLLNIQNRNILEIYYKIYKYFIFRIYSEAHDGFGFTAVILGGFVFFLFPGNILDGEHPTRPWRGGFHQPMRTDSANLEDGIPASDIMESSYPWLESAPQDRLKHTGLEPCLPPQTSFCISRSNSTRICRAQLRSH